MPVISLSDKVLETTVVCCLDSHLKEMLNFSYRLMKIEMQLSSHPIHRTLNPKHKFSKDSWTRVKNFCYKASHWVTVLA